jgi:subtilase family serine protease
MRNGNRHTFAVACAIAITAMLAIAYGSAGAEDRLTIASNHPGADQASFVAAPPSQPLEMEITLKLRNEPALDQFLADQQDPRSPEYQRALSAVEFNRFFGPSQQDVREVTDWLARRGFTVLSADAASRLVRFSGTVATVRAVFGVDIKASRDGLSFANDRDPVAPAAIAAKIEFLNGLDNLSDYVANALVAGSGTTTPQFGPQDMQTFYDELPLLNATPPIDGSKADCIGAIEGSDVDDASLAAFNTQFNLPAFTASNFVRDFPDGSASVAGGSAYTESLLDIEWSHALAPGAKIILYAGNYPVLGNQGLVDALAGAVKANQCGALAVSFGTCGTAKYFKMIDKYYKQAVAQKQTVLVATGDDGAAWPGKVSPFGGCYQPKTADINEMAGSTNVTAVGATQFTATYDQNGDDVGFVPEQVYNSCVTLSTGTICFGATGGGKSQVFAKPSYQSALTPADGTRDIPDVVLGGSPIGLPAFYLAYASSLYAPGLTGGAKVYCCVGGTSLDAPAVAAIVALIEHKKGGRIGNINSRLYALAKAHKKTLSAIGLRDVTQGNNTYWFGLFGPTETKVKGYNAGKGYDLASGLGSIEIATFLNAFLAP